MNFSTMSDKQIIEEMAKSLEEMRLINQVSTDEMSKKGGYNSQTYSNFLNRGANIKISTLIQVMRGMGELDKLQKAFDYKIPYSPTGKNSNLPKRIFRKKENKADVIEWGDE